MQPLILDHHYFNASTSANSLSTETGQALSDGSVSDHSATEEFSDSSGDSSGSDDDVMDDNDDDVDESADGASSDDCDSNGSSVDTSDLPSHVRKSLRLIETVPLQKAVAGVLSGKMNLLTARRKYCLPWTQIWNACQTTAKQAGLDWRKNSSTEKAKDNRNDGKTLVKKYQKKNLPHPMMSKSLGNKETVSVACKKEIKRGRKVEKTILPQTNTAKPKVEYQKEITEKMRRKYNKRQNVPSTNQYSVSNTSSLVLDKCIASVLQYSNYAANCSTKKRLSLKAALNYLSVNGHNVVLASRRFDVDEKELRLLFRQLKAFCNKLKGVDRLKASTEHSDASCHSSSAFSKGINQAVVKMQRCDSSASKELLPSTKANQMRTHGQTVKSSALSSASFSSPLEKAIKVIVESCCKGTKVEKDLISCAVRASLTQNMMSQEVVKRFGLYSEMILSFYTQRVREYLDLENDMRKLRAAPTAQPVDLPKLPQPIDNVHSAHRLQSGERWICPPDGYNPNRFEVDN